MGRLIRFADRKSPCRNIIIVRHGHYIINDSAGSRKTKKLTSSDGIGPERLFCARSNTILILDNPPSVVGSDPEKLFLSALKECNAFKAPSSDGNEPKNPLLGMTKPRRLVRSPISLGSVDDIFVLPKRSEYRAFKFPISVGKVPEKSFPLAMMVCSLVRIPISEGMLPEKLLTDIQSSSNSVDRRKSSGGRVPLKLFVDKYNFYPGRRIQQIQLTRWWN